MCRCEPRGPFRGQEWEEVRNRPPVLCYRLKRPQDSREEGRYAGIAGKVNPTGTNTARNFLGAWLLKECKHCGEKHTILGAECQVCKNAMFRYKMNRNDIIQLHKSQGGKCVLCQCEVELFRGYKGGQIDHDHETGRVRGILCLKCNVAVGSLENRRIDNITLMLHYIGYIKEPEQSIA